MKRSLGAKIAIAAYWAAWLAIAVVFLCGCQRIDYQREEYRPNGTLKSLQYISKTDWATDSSSVSIEINNDGSATATGYGKEEDSIQVEVDPLSKKASLKTSN